MFLFYLLSKFLFALLYCILWNKNLIKIYLWFFLLIKFFSGSQRFWFIYHLFFPIYYFESRNCSLRDAQGNTRKHQKIHSTKNNGSVTQNFSDGDSWYHFSCKIFFYTRTFRKHRRVLLQRFSVVWDKRDKKLTKILIHRMSLVFPYQKFIETPWEPHHEKFLGYKMFSTTSCDTPLYSSTEFRYSTNGQLHRFPDTPNTSKRTKTQKKLFFKDREIKFCWKKIRRQILR